MKTMQAAVFVEKGKSSCARYPGRSRGLAKR